MLNLNQVKCRELLDKLMSISEETAHAILRECGMNTELERVDQIGNTFSPTEQELLHLEDILAEAIEFMKAETVEDGTIAFDAQGHLVQLDDNRLDGIRVTEYF